MSFLCLSEKLEIALYEGENLLNKKTTNFQNTVVKTSSCYCVMILKTENELFLKKPLYCKFTVIVD